MKPARACLFSLASGSMDRLSKAGRQHVIEPLSAQIAVDVKDIALEHFQSYVDKYARLDVIDGRWLWTVRSWSPNRHRINCC